MGHDRREHVPATTYVALLRGINVGRARPVAMDALREIVASLGHRDVRTFLRSGNVVFRGPRQDAADVAAGLEQTLAAELGMSIGVVVRTMAELGGRRRCQPDP